MRHKKTYDIDCTLYEKFTVSTRKSIKLMLMDSVGCKCQICGYNKCMNNLSFHHKNPSLKRFNISSEILLHPWQILIKEACKCIIVCHNCHGEINDGLLDVSHVPTIKFRKHNETTINK